MGELPVEDDIGEKFDWKRRRAAVVKEVRHTSCLTFASPTLPPSLPAFLPAFLPGPPTRPDFFFKVSQPSRPTPVRLPRLSETTEPYNIIEKSIYVVGKMQDSGALGATI